MKTSVYLGLLLGPCAYVLGTGAGGANGAGEREVDWVVVAACLTYTASNQALSLVTIDGMGAGTGGAIGMGGREVDWAMVMSCLT